ncbi:MAG TPA: SAM-dependent chlorinase/fluorinase [Gaiella sp.]|uniref:SAM hydrolase/SAM-dependent halogenase family protein n=1 Tax=Gaiella sp. TaxID=2663207 RepID=UPI002D7E2F69|nr:SAM-dependent chlorinase/fluorinase [Gaiella sp.]HET9286501.1 SAM-dependent chlorinase/fluorinase [Gaiella sp.]
MSSPRPIVFLSDFGLGNEWVGLCHAVMSGISPQCPITDLSHLVRPLEVASGALLLADSMPYIPENAVILAVVDPNVGKDREIAIETESGRHLVGPDNGLLSLAWDAAGGIRSAIELTSPDVVRPPHAESFRAPDTLCPPTAALAAGRPLAELGTPLDPATLAVVEMAEPEVEAGKITCEVIDFNRFGNVHLNVRPADLAAAGLDGEATLLIEAVSGSADAKRGSTYADFAAGEYGVLFDTRGWLTIVRGNPASALDGLGLALAAPVWLTRSAAGR